MVYQWWIYNSLFIKQGKDTKLFFPFLNIDNLSLTSQSWLCIFSCLETVYETTMQDRKKCNKSTQYFFIENMG